jgi:cobalt-zinc-cadmium efflux system membrane fusion protein
MKPTQIVLAIVFLAGGAAIGALAMRGVSADRSSHVAATQAAHNDAHAEHGAAELPAKPGAPAALQGDRCIPVSPEAAASAGVETEEAAGGAIEETLNLPGEIVFNADKVAHIVPRVPGIVRRVDKVLGDAVKAGEVMAVLESRELAEAKAAFLAASQRLALAQANFKSAEEMHARKIMPDLEYMTVRKEVAGAEIEAKTAEYKLHALGVQHEECSRLNQEEQALSMHEMRAPFAGTLVEKHCSLGEVVNEQRDCFVLADLASVWADVAVYPNDLARVVVGQRVHLRTDGLSADGEIFYVSHALSETTRTALARVLVPNTDARWKPGMFITAAIVLGKSDAKVLVPNDAIQTIEGRPAVFIACLDDFELRHVKVGRSNATHTEILEGLKPAEQYVSKNAFVLKAELSRVLRGAAGVADACCP